MTRHRRADDVPALSRSFLRALRPTRRRPDALPADAQLTDSASVDRDRLTIYQRVCGFDVSDSVPPTFLHVLSFPAATAIMARPDFPLPLIGLVHVANAMQVHQPVAAGAELTIDVRAEALRPHRAGRQVDLVAEVSQDASLVWSGRSTYLHREPTEPKSAGARAPRPALTDVGGAPAQLRVPADIGRRYAAVSGDRNPIHLYPLTARAFGFPRAIAHGMWLHARLLATLHARLPATYRAEIEFKTPVLLPATVALATTGKTDGWHLAAADARSGKPHAALTITATT